MGSWWLKEVLALATLCSHMVALTCLIWKAIKKSIKAICLLILFCGCFFPTLSGQTGCNLHWYLKLKLSIISHLITSLLLSLGQYWLVKRDSLVLHHLTVSFPTKLYHGIFKHLSFYFTLIKGKMFCPVWMVLPSRSLFCTLIHHLGYDTFPGTGRQI